MYIYFILHLNTIYTFDFCFFKNGELIQNSQMYFFCFAEWKYATYLLNQHI